MRVLPVLDLKRGQVVRGLAGRRDEYRPITSLLTASADPIDVARAFQDRFGLTEIYLADLDAIAGSEPSLPLFTELGREGFFLWVDAGLRDAEGAAPLFEAGVGCVVAGLETVAGPGVLESLCRRFGDRIAFSLDLKEGRAMGNASAWPDANARSIADRAVAAGVRRVIVLDLARVGTGTGTGTESLCRDLSAAYREVELLAGGGVRSLDDLWRLRQCGVHAALVASALHDGRLRPQNLAGL